MAAESTAGAGAAPASASAGKRCFLLPGWGSTPDAMYWPQLTKHLQAHGVDVTGIDLPTNTGEISKYIENLTRVVGAPDANTFFVGQSVGCQVIMRYLASLPAGSKVGGFVAIAGWLTCDRVVEGTRESWWEAFFKDDWDKLSPWCDESTLDFARLREVAAARTALLADNDPVRGLDTAGETNFADFRDTTKVGARVVVCEGRGHFLVDTLLDAELAEIDATLSIGK